ncbi:ATP-binding protein [Desulfurobacterium atlanticum]|nr:ATP-binding protein [Desulfurobacterium atlanticum]
MNENTPGELGEIAKSINKLLEIFKKFTYNEKIFIASVSHELRTPLNGIIGFLNLLLQSNLSKEQQMYVENAEKSARQLLELIEDLLDTTKIQTGQIEIRKEEFDLNQIIQEVIATVSSRKKAKSLKFINKIPNFPNIFIGDKKRVKQILLNLLSNAFKYTKEGFIELGIKDIKETDKNTIITFYIKDTGIGIPKEKQKEMFKPFVRIHSQETKEIKGTGLGLYISKSLAKLMGGDIWFESEEGKGTTFYFKIPLEKGRKKTEEELKALQIKPPAEKKLDNFSNIKILAAEDEPINRKLLQKIFEKNFNIKDIDIVENGFEAYKKAIKNNYDIIFLDIQMPVMDGFEALERIRKAGIKTPVYMLTADAYKDTETKAMKLGANGYITKPIELDKLTEILREIKKK